MPNRRRRATPTPKQPPIPPSAARLGIPANARLFISLSGHSNSLGTDSALALTTTQPFDGLRRTGTTGIPLVETVHTTFGESPASAAGNFVRGADGTREVIFDSWGTGSAGYAQIQRGSGQYILGQAGVHDAVNWIAANRPSEVFYPAALMIVHGEQDDINGDSAATYAAHLAQLQSDFENDVKTMIGNVNDIPLFITQGTAGAETNPPFCTTNSAVGGWLASLTNPKIVLVGPMYWATWLANNPHLSAPSARRLGRYFGRALYRRLILNENWKPLQPSSIIASDNLVVLDVEGGDGSTLVLDTTNMSRRGHTYGFGYSDSQADVPVITNVAITGGRHVTLTLNRNAQGPARITYGTYSAVTIDPGASAASQLAAGGNLRDSDPTPSGDGDLPLYNWCAVFDRAVDSVTGTASPSTTFANTASLDSNGAARNLASAQNLSFSGLANCSLSFYVRYNTGSWPNSNQGILGKSFSNHRCISIQTASGGVGGRMRVFLATGANDTSNFMTYDGIWSGATWYHVVIIKNGTSLSLYRNGVLQTGVLTGAVPATMTASIGDFQLLNVGDSIPGNFNLAHVGIWLGTALTSGNVATLYNAGTPIDPRSLSPSHYWPLQSTYEDLGTAPTRNLVGYGTLAFEAIHP